MEKYRDCVQINFLLISIFYGMIGQSMRLVNFFPDNSKMPCDIKFYKDVRIRMTWHKNLS